MHEPARDLLGFIDASPTPYHAVAETARRLEEHGYERLHEGDPWTTAPGTRAYVVRGGSVIAFDVGTAPPSDAGFRIIGAHTDSPNLRIKPHADYVAGGLHVLAAEPYGGVLLHTWLDRDLGIAGRVVVRTGTGTQETHNVRLDQPAVRIPNLAIHLNREIRTDGLKINPQKEMSPVLGLSPSRSLREILADAVTASGEAPVDPDAILSWDLMVHDLQPAALGGEGDAFVYAPRLDNLASCHAGLTALLAQDTGVASTRVLACWDHEEVGSRSASGAAGPFLRDVLERLSGPGEAHARAVAGSTLISADMAHAVHPHFLKRHEPLHMPVLGSGPVVKVNTNQSYASDAETVALFVGLCAQENVPLQRFVNRADLGCGSTIGPVSSTRLGIPTVDVGGPMLSMHSVREMAASADVGAMIQVMRAYFARD